MLYVKRNNLVSESVEGKLYILDEENNKVIELNPTAAFVWENIKTSTKFNHLLGLLTGEFEVDEKVAEADLRNILTEFEKKGLVKLKEK